MSRKNQSIARLGRIGIKGYGTRLQMISAEEQKTQITGQVCFEATGSTFWRKTERTTSSISDYEKLSDFSSFNRIVKNLTIYHFDTEAAMLADAGTYFNGDFAHINDTHQLFVMDRVGNYDEGWKPVTKGEGVLDYWAADKDYDSDSVVIHGGDLYANLSGENTPNSPDAEPDAWLKISDLNNADPFDNTKTYNKGDRIFLQEQIWECVVDGTTGSPTTVPDNWTRVKFYWDVWPTWRPSADYHTNDMVAHAGTVYRRKTEGVTPDTPNSDPDNWEEIGSAYIPVWEYYDPNKTYDSGSIIFDSDGGGHATYWITDNDGTTGRPWENSQDWRQISDQWYATPVIRSNEKYAWNDIINYRGVLYRNISGESNYPDVTPDEDTVNWIRLDNIEVEIWDSDAKASYDSDNIFIKAKNSSVLFVIPGSVPELSELTELRPSEMFTEGGNLYRYDYVTSDSTHHIDTTIHTIATLVGLHPDVKKLDLGENRATYPNIIGRSEIEKVGEEGIYTRSSPFANAADSDGYILWTGSGGIEAAVPKWQKTFKYYPGDIVAFNNAIYQLQEDSEWSIGDNPEETVIWYPIYEKDKIFDPVRWYLPGAVVEHKGKEYIKLSGAEFPEPTPGDSDSKDVWIEKNAPPFVKSYATYSDLYAAEAPGLDAEIAAGAADSDALRAGDYGRSLFFVEDTNSRWMIDITRTVELGTANFIMADEEFVAAESTLTLLTNNFPPSKFLLAEREKALVTSVVGLSYESKPYISDGVNWIEYTPTQEHLDHVINDVEHNLNDNSWSTRVDLTIAAAPVGHLISVTDTVKQMVHVQSWDPKLPAGHEYMDLAEDDTVFNWSRRQNVLQGDVCWPVLTDKSHPVNFYDETLAGTIWDMNYNPQTYVGYGVRPELWPDQYDGADDWDTFNMSEISQEVKDLIDSKGLPDFPVRISKQPDSEVYLQFWFTKESRWKLVASSTNTKNEGPWLDYTMCPFDSETVVERRWHLPQDYYDRISHIGYANEYLIPGGSRSYDSPTTLQKSDFYATAYFPRGPLVAGCLMNKNERFISYDTDVERNWIPSTRTDQDGNFTDPDPFITITNTNVEGDDSEGRGFWFFGVRVQPIQRERTDYEDGYVTKGGHPNRMTFVCYRDGNVIDTIECSLTDDYTRASDPTDRNPDNFYPNIQYIDVFGNNFHSYSNNKKSVTMDFGTYYKDIYAEYRPGIYCDKVIVKFDDWQDTSEGNAKWHRENFGVSYFCPIVADKRADSTGTGTLRNEHWIRTGMSDVVDDFRGPADATSWQRIAQGVQTDSMLNNIYGESIRYLRKKEGRADSRIKGVNYIRDGYPDGTYYDSKIWARDLWLRKRELVYHEFEEENLKDLDLYNQIRSDLKAFWRNR
ncbi:MAG: hypothetical protein N0C84_01160 [Candidatus Thiodiazotropha taylori]|uniref:Chitin-binding type-3 domain-containing protein n=1 Tax=Candidatus Thiodiazotropha taylori TaxID=2792791 RepID=A0A9E4N374_9GAMM|nr:hypothetical protein [Candidatus Thiodiazotropha taylori]MCW4255055.1 hypothetical protein [Candidatus Thiodiazotropha taylori]